MRGPPVAVPCPAGSWARAGAQRPSAPAIVTARTTAIRVAAGAWWLLAMVSSRGRPARRGSHGPLDAVEQGHQQGDREEAAGREREEQERLAGGQRDARE